MVFLDGRTMFYFCRRIMHYGMANIESISVLVSSGDWAFTESIKM